MHAQAQWQTLVLLTLHEVEVPRSGTEPTDLVIGWSQPTWECLGRAQNIDSWWAVEHLHHPRGQEPAYLNLSRSQDAASRAHGPHSCYWQHARSYHHLLCFRVVHGGNNCSFHQKHHHSDHSRMVQAAWFHHIHQVENFVVAWAQSGQDASSKFLASLQQRVVQVCSEQPTPRELLQSSIERFLSISGQNHAIMAASNWTYFSSCNSSKHTQDVQSRASHSFCR